MAKKETSPRISSAAARLLAYLPKRGKITIAEGAKLERRDGSHAFWWFPVADAAMSVATLRSLLTSLISQDETPGQKPTRAKRRRGLR